MQARALIVGVSWAVFSSIAGCGGASTTDVVLDGGHDGPTAGEAGDQDPPDTAKPDASDGGSSEVDAPSEADGPCECPPTPPAHGQACACSTPCKYCEPAKWELTSASCNSGKWYVVTQWDTPCGDN